MRSCRWCTAADHSGRGRNGDQPLGPSLPPHLQSDRERTTAVVPEPGAAEWSFRVRACARGRRAECSGFTLTRRSGWPESARFLELVPFVEQAIIDSGVILLKYWLEVSQEEQTRRLTARIDDGRKTWKLATMDLEIYGRWYDYSKTRDAMFSATDTTAGAMGPEWGGGGKSKRQEGAVQGSCSCTRPRRTPPGSPGKAAPGFGDYVMGTPSACDVRLGGLRAPTTSTS